MKGKDMKNKTIIKIIIAAVAVLLVGVLAFVVVTKIQDSKNPDAEDSELVAPSVAVPGADNVGNDADNAQSWNENATLVNGADEQTTAPEMPDEKPGEVETLADAQEIDTADLAVADRVTLVINARHKLSADYVPHLEETVTGSGVYLEAQAAEAFMEMYKAALGQGLTLTPYSGYVSFDRQQSKYDNLTKQYVEMGYSEAEAQALAARKILPAGCSEHNAGLAVDLGSNTADFEDTAEYKWLVKNAAKYGFIERYTDEFEDETGVDAAAWHWRYVGSAAMAEAINESDMSFEEWMYYEYPDWENPEEAEEDTTEALTDDAETDEEENTVEDADEEDTAAEDAEEEDTEFVEGVPEEEATTVVIDLDEQ